MLNLIVVLLSISTFSFADDCKPSLTTASGWASPEKVCSGQLIFDENFNTLDKKKWKPEISLGGGGNEEFQWYVSDDENSFAKDGKLHIKPTLTADKIGEDAIEHGHVRLDDCTDRNRDNCERQAGGDIIINPVRSARLITRESFSFKFGRVEVVAKTPQGDWLWPAIWLLPTYLKYGNGLRSGEIDLMESRGNVKFGNEVELGCQAFSSALHFGARWNLYRTVNYQRNNASGFDKDFHKYELIWNEHGIKYLVDGSQVGFVAVGDGFWARGRFNGDNIWANGTKMAPFDEEFYFIINVAVGGGGYFPDGLQNQNGPKPWRNRSKTAMRDFWTQRNQWEKTWDWNGKSSLIVDNVKIWAL